MHNVGTDGKASKGVIGRQGESNITKAEDVWYSSVPPTGCT